MPLRRKTEVQSISCQRRVDKRTDERIRSAGMMGFTYVFIVIELPAHVASLTTINTSTPVGGIVLLVCTDGSHFVDKAGHFVQLVELCFSSIPAAPVYAVAHRPCLSEQH